MNVLKEIEVGKVIIGKQFEDCENLQEFIEIVNDKKINVSVVKVGDRINIQKNLYFDVLWPTSSNFVTDNAINNNSLVCKLVYKNFSMLFTGDIEEVAEKEILAVYKNSNILKSTILKVAHHGSKTSSVQEFIDVVKPKIALIGVGANNTFGHPNSEVLNRLDELRGKNL